jgi:hypothetical protein
MLSVPPNTTAPLVAVLGVNPVEPPEKDETPPPPEIAAVDNEVTLPFASIVKTGTVVELPTLL